MGAFSVATYFYSINVENKCFIYFKLGMLAIKQGAKVNIYHKYIYMYMSDIWVILGKNYIAYYNFIL